MVAQATISGKTPTNRHKGQAGRRCKGRQAVVEEAGARQAGGMARLVVVQLQAHAVVDLCTREDGGGCQPQGSAWPQRGPVRARAGCKQAASCPPGPSWQQRLPSALTVVCQGDVVLVHCQGGRGGPWWCCRQHGWRTGHRAEAAATPAAHDRKADAVLQRSSCPATCACTHPCTTSGCGSSLAACLRGSGGRGGSWLLSGWPHSTPAGSSTRAQAAQLAPEPARAPVCAATIFFRSPTVSSSLHLTRIWGGGGGA